MKAEIVSSTDGNRTVSGVNKTMQQFMWFAPKPKKKEDKCLKQD